MKTTNLFAHFLITLAVVGNTNRAWCDTFGSGANTFEIDFINIGNPGNPADTTGSPNPVGAVPYSFRMGIYEISEQMVTKANALGGLGITQNSRGVNRPATSISWFEAAKFVNWLNTTTGNSPAYKFDSGGNFLLWQPSDSGYNASNLYRNDLARYFLPTNNEWYKGAYYDPTSGAYYDYPTGSNAAPTAISSGVASGTAVYGGQSGPANITTAGGLSPYGTMAQGGNAFEWMETEFDLVNNSNSQLTDHTVRGGFYGGEAFYMLSSNRYNFFPIDQAIYDGFRVGSSPIPEPTSLILCAAGVLAWVLRKSR